MNSYFNKYQLIANETLKNCKRSNKFPSAILVNGQSDSPLLEIAKHIAKFVVCNEEEPCNECLNCLKIENENYADLIIVDGKEKSIKKGDIEDIQERFSMTPIEENGVKIYIINYIENATAEAVNSLLKFLEEPLSEIYAILTTANINNVLPTIISRCMNIRLKKASKQELVVEVTKKGISIEDALILSTFLGSVNSIVDSYENSSYLSIKDVIIEFFEELLEGEDLLYFSEIEISDIVKDKNDFLMFLNLLEIVYNDILNFRNNTQLTFYDHKDLIEKLSSKFDNISEKLEVIMPFKGCASSNANVKLLLDSLIIKLERSQYNGK